MSDTSQGPGWWYASDGKWYPPATADPTEPAVGGGTSAEEPPAWSPPDQEPVPPVPPSYPSHPPSDPSYAPDPSYAAGPPSYPSYGTPPWTPPGSPDPAASPKRSSKLPLLVAAAVVLAVLVIGGVVASTRSSSDKAASTIDSSTSTTAASGAGSSSTTDGSVPADYSTFQDNADDFSIATPATWKQVSLSDPKAQAAIDTMIADNPKMAATLGSATKLATSGVKFLAAKPGGSADVIVMVQHAGGAPEHPSDDDLTTFLNDDLAPQIAKIGGTLTFNDIITVNGRKALEVRYDLPVKFGALDMTGHGIYYIFVTRDTIHQVAILASADEADKIISTFTIG